MPAVLPASQAVFALAEGGVDQCGDIGCHDHFVMKKDATFQTFWGMNVLRNDAGGVYLVDWDTVTTHGYRFALVSGGVPQILIPKGGLKGLTTHATYRVSDGIKIEFNVFFPSRLKRRPWMTAFKIGLRCACKVCKISYHLSRKMIFSIGKL